MILDKLIESTKKRVERTKETKSPKELIKALDGIKLKEPRFKSALESYDGVSVIAEIKRSSPSKGLIRSDFDHMKIAEEYSRCGVQALSILTEPEYFGGSLDYVRDISGVTDIPILRKDFVIDEYMIYEAKLAGADAILLIMAALTDEEYKRFSRTAKELKLDTLVETHNEEEVKRALECDGIIGVNNRNLATFEENITTCEKLLPLIPDDRVKVAESAVRTHDDYRYLQSLRFDAALIGEAFMRADDIGSAVDVLRYGERNS